jgi:hypothetical protein
MGWIKRNLVFTITAVLALALLLGAGFFIYEGWARYSETSERLTGLYDSLQKLNQQSPSPGSEKVNNITTAKDQEQDIQKWLQSVNKYFQNPAPIPSEKPVASDFATGLRRTIDGLQHKAEAGGIQLPSKYDFSFGAEKDRVTFAAGSLEPLAAQLGEVKAISDILLSVRLHALMGIQRVRVSEDDVNGPQSDYLDLKPVTNSLAVIVPYVVTFRCFTPELSKLVSNFGSAPNAFIIKYVNVRPANAATTALTPEGLPPGGMPGQPPTAPNQPVIGRGGLQTILKEQLLQVTMEIDIIKLLPKS